MDRVYPPDGQDPSTQQGWRDFRNYRQQQREDMSEKIWNVAEQRKNGRDIRQIQATVHGYLYGAFQGFKDADPTYPVDWNPNPFAQNVVGPHTHVRDVPSSARRLTPDAQAMQELADAGDPLAASVLALYADISEQAAPYLRQRDELLTRLTGTTPNRADAPLYGRADLLLSLSLQLMREHGNDPAQRPTLERAIAVVRQALWKEAEQSRLLADVLKSVPANEWSQIELESLDQVDFQAPVPCTELTDAGVRKQIEAITRASFPADGADFKKFLDRDDTFLCYASCDGEIIASFGVEQNEQGVLRIDWLCMNPRSDLRGLTEALVVSGIRQAEARLKPRGVYCATKPHVKSHYISIEHVGTVGYGLTDDEADTYVRCRRVPEEKNVYVGKSLSTAEIKDLATQCAQPNTLMQRTINGRPCEIALVEFHDKGPEMDRADLGEEGRIYDWIEQGTGTRVLTRYVPLHAVSDGYTVPVQTYLAIFEDAALTPVQSDTFDREAGLSA